MTDALALHQRAQSLVAEASAKLAPIEYLKAQVGGMSRADVEALAVAYLLGQVKGRKRRATLTVEREAERVAWVAPPPTPEMVEARTRLAIEAEHRGAESLKAMWADITELTDAFVAEMRVEWTRDLLESEFSLGDGTAVKWGDATREQHRGRIAMHQRNALAGIEGAARHKKALDELDSTGAQTLREAVAVLA